jgi:hypothetical protein
MPGGKPYKKPVSQAQARLFGAAAGGNVPGFSPADAKNKLRGVKESSLPARKASPKRRKRTS